jgi:hypothetical protein
MSVEVEVIQAKPKHQEFPCLMISLDEDIIVLMTDVKKGTTLWSELPEYPVGEFNELWDMDYFVTFQGVLRIQNKED